MTSGRSYLVDVRCRLLRESDTGLAWLLDDGRVKVWLPKTWVELDPPDFKPEDLPADVVATMSESVAREKGFDSSAEPGQGRLL